MTVLCPGSGTWPKAPVLSSCCTWGCTANLLEFPRSLHGVHIILCGLIIDGTGHALWVHDCSIQGSLDSLCQSSSVLARQIASLGSTTPSGPQLSKALPSDSCCSQALVVSAASHCGFCDTPWAFSSGGWAWQCSSLRRLSVVDGVAFARDQRGCTDDVAQSKCFVKWHIR